MKRVLPSVLLVGFALAALEALWVLPRAGELFLSFEERAVYVLTAALGIGTAVLAMAALLYGAVHPRCARVGPIAFSLGASAAAARLAWLVSDGRRVRDLALRPFAVALLAALFGGLCYALLRLVAAREQLAPRSRIAAASALASLCVALTTLDVLVLPRGYPAFHMGLELAIVLSASAASLLVPALERPRPARALRIAAPLVALAAPFALAHLAAHPTAGFAVRESSPWTAKLMAPFSPRAQAELDVAAEGLPDVSRAKRGVDLRDRDVLLITVDALRADVLRAYGGSGNVPTLDRLADESAVFLRAYTPAPHTSYALASLLTGKFVKPLVELGGKLGDPPTLPDRLRRYGYRTAAFYPPAIFFVDGESFAPLARRGFGFEYRKEMFASADDRVAQLDEYLAQAEPRPLFVWVHLFEPHEPYDPPSDIAHDGSERGRYLAEVLACDRAIAKLVERFRAARPNATVIVTADHGEEFGEHGGSFHGSTLYDEQVRVPLLWSSPGAVTPRAIVAPVELTDVGTTILSTAGVPRDAHMRGDDLSGLLAGGDEGPALAFASIAGRHMVTDGREKAICDARDPHCALFDLEADPRETRNLAGERSERVDALRRELDRFLASVPKFEALAVSEGVRFPEALARVKLGGSATAEELVPLLFDARQAVRAEAARALGESRLAEGREPLERARRDDGDPSVRAEATIAALRLGVEGALPDALALLEASRTAEDRDRARRAALAVAPLRPERAVPVLSQLALDESATEIERVRALRALGASKSEHALAPLLEAMASVRLRQEAASALAQLGDARALAPLRAQFELERYPEARRAELLALEALGDRSIAALARQALGRESSVPEGVALLARVGALSPPSRVGALLREASRLGAWACTGEGCTPEADARLELPARGARIAGPVRVVIAYAEATPGSTLAIDGEPFALPTRSGQLSFVRPSASAAARLSFAASAPLSLLAVAVVPSLAELPPPAPEPWDGGTDEPADAGASSEVVGASIAPSR